METLRAQFKNRLNPLYDELFSDLNVEKETAFVMQWGDKFPTEINTGILFVGKAVNGWFGKKYQSFEKLLNITNKMQWVKDQWNRKKTKDSKKQPYITKRSAFWKVIKGITLEYYKDPNQWHSYVAWSNLFKKSPNDRGNPQKIDEKLKDLCKRILKAEIEILSPKYVIFLTSGWEEKYKFLKYLNDNQSPKMIDEQKWKGKNKEYKVGLYNINDTIYITSVHPQGKKEAPHIKTIVEFLSK